MRSKLSETVGVLNVVIGRVGEDLLTTITDARTAFSTGTRSLHDDEALGVDESTSSANQRIQAVERPKERYLSPEERVIEFITDHSDGQIWQGTIVEEMSWSSSKTSRVLSAMEEHGRILRHRVGKRKCVYLPGSEPDILK